MIYLHNDASIIAAQIAAQDNTTIEIFGEKFKVVKVTIHDFPTIPTRFAIVQLIGTDQ